MDKIIPLKVSCAVCGDCCEFTIVGKNIKVPLPACPIKAQSLHNETTHTVASRLWLCSLALICALAQAARVCSLHWGVCPLCQVALPCSRATASTTVGLRRLGVCYHRRLSPYQSVALLLSPRVAVCVVLCVPPRWWLHLAGGSFGIAATVTVYSVCILDWYEPSTLCCILGGCEPERATRTPRL